MLAIVNQLNDLKSGGQKVYTRTLSRTTNMGPTRFLKVKSYQQQWLRGLGQS